jgi:hypothetical protein
MKFDPISNVPSYRKDEDFRVLDSIPNVSPYQKAEGFRVLDWVVRQKVPAYLDAAGLQEQASLLRAHACVMEENALETQKLLIRVMKSRDPHLDKVVDFDDTEPSSEARLGPLYWCMARTRYVDEHQLYFYANWIIAGCETLIKRQAKTLETVEQEVETSLMTLGYISDRDDLS